MPTDPWAAFPAVSAPSAPSFPGVIPGRPKTIAPPTPIQLEDQEMDRERLRLSQEEAARQTKKDAEGTSDERTAGFLAGRLVDAVGRLSTAVNTDATAASPTFGVETTRKVLGDTAANYLTDSERQQVRAAQIDMLDAALTLGTGAAYNKEQLEGYREAYFPQLGDAEGTIASKREALRSLIVNAQKKAGRAAPGIDQALAAIDSLSKPTTKLPGDSEWTPSLAATKWGEGVFDDKGAPLGPGGGEGFDANGKSLGLYGEATDDSPDVVDPRIAADAAQMDKITGPMGLADLARHGLSLGLTDEAAGVGKALGEALKGHFNVAENFRRGRDTEQFRIDEARQRLGVGGMVMETLGGFALPASALGRVATVGEATGGGAVAGALSGYGYSQGDTTSAGIGMVAGGALGNVGQRIGGALAARSSKPALVANATALDAAGRAEGVTVNRAMVDPALQNRVTGVDATIIGGPKVQRGMRAIEGQIEGRVEALGVGATPLNPIALGDTAQNAGNRFIAKSGQSAARKYDRAERLAGAAKVTPTTSLQAVDGMIAQLGQTPGTNSGEIAFLNTLKSDLSQDLSVGALRRMRTSLRKRISKGELTFGEDESRVLGIMDAAADDIRAGLTQQGKGEAAQAFDAADKSYRARMEYINGTVQKLIGKRGANLSSEQVAGKLRSMAANDARGLRKFAASLTPDERADVAATFAESLGTNNKDGFTVAQFMRQTSSKNLSDETARTLFGQEGLQSIKNLRTLGQQVERVTGAMNSRTSKTGVANNYKDWLINGLLGASATGGAAAGGGVTALGAGGGLMAANGLRNALSARSLMSPKISRWLLQAPATASPRAIDAHFARLGEIAKAEPALSGEIESLRRAIMGAANDNAATMASAARDEDPNEGK